MVLRFLHHLQPTIPVPALPAISKAKAALFIPSTSQTTVTDPSSCQSEIRLVAQVFNSSQIGLGPADSGVHLLYRVTRQQLDAALNELVAICDTAGASTAAVPSGPHPAMLKQDLGGSFAQGVNLVIQKYVGRSNLYEDDRIR